MILSTTKRGAIFVDCASLNMSEAGKAMTHTRGNPQLEVVRYGNSTIHSDVYCIMSKVVRRWMSL